jgi:uncharacterized protein YbjT (DUF2867 family)
MAERKVIAVVGATGAQGGAVVRAILADPSKEFAVRAITRDVTSDKAKALAAAGAEVVSADVNDVESLKRAFAGAYGAYCVTFYWADFSAENELKQAKNMADAAKSAGLKHVVWSTLEDTRKFYPLEDEARMPNVEGKYKVPHFDAKGEADQFFKGVPTTFMMASFYWDNFIHFGAGPTRGEDGKLVLNMPMANNKMGGIGTDDIGRSALGIFKRPDLIGQTVGIASDFITGDEIAKEMSDALGEPVTYNAVPFDVYRGLGFPGAVEMGNMFQFYAEQEKYFETGRNVALTKEIDPGLENFKTWLSKHAGQIPR